MEQTLAQAAEHIAVVAEAIQSASGADDGTPARVEELVTDKGHHSRKVVRTVEESGIRTYISEPEEDGSVGKVSRANSVQSTGTGDGYGASAASACSGSEARNSSG